MACEMAYGRPQTVLANAQIDQTLADAAQRYAAQHGVLFEDLIECALLNFMAVNSEPVIPQWCASHGVPFIHSSSITGGSCCPVGEGESMDSPLVFVPERIYPDRTPF